MGIKDWTGNSNSIFKTLGSSHHSVHDREEHDYYATEPRATELLIGLEEFHEGVWEPACGAGHISQVLESAGYLTYSTDLVDRGYGKSGIDFLQQTEPWGGHIVTNPPYKFANAFVLKALSLIPDGCKVVMLLKVQFVEGKERKKLFEQYPPRTIYVSSSRLNCAKNGDFTGLRSSGGSAVAYAWFVWEKGYKGDTSLKWFN